MGDRRAFELTASYDRGPWSLYGNLAWSRAMGNDINSAQFNFGADELAFIANNFIHLDHDQTWDGSAGVAYTLNRGSDHPTLFSVDALLQSGLRASTPTVPNGIALPTYGVVNLSVVQKLPTQHGAAAGCAERWRYRSIRSVTGPAWGWARRNLGYGGPYWRGSHSAFDCRAVSRRDGGRIGGTIYGDACEGDACEIELGRGNVFPYGLVYRRGAWFGSRSIGRQAVLARLLTGPVSNFEDTTRQRNSRPRSCYHRDREHNPHTHWVPTRAVGLALRQRRQQRALPCGMRRPLPGSAPKS